MTVCRSWNHALRGDGLWRAQLERAGGRARGGSWYERWVAWWRAAVQLEAVWPCERPRPCPANRAALARKEAAWGRLPAALRTFAQLRHDGPLLVPCITEWERVPGPAGPLLHLGLRPAPHFTHYYVRLAGFDPPVLASPHNLQLHALGVYGDVPVELVEAAPTLSSFLGQALAEPVEEYFEEWLPAGLEE